MGWYHDGESRYGPALRITDKRTADEFFAQLVAKNMKSAGGVRKKREAEAIERRNLAHFVANMDEEVKARVARLFKVARVPAEMLRDVPDPALAPPRPGPHVSPIGGLTDTEVEILEKGGFAPLPAGPQKRVKKRQQRKPTVDPRRRDSWKPWQDLYAAPASLDGNWKPYGWIEV